MSSDEATSSKSPGPSTSASALKSTEESETTNDQQVDLLNFRSTDTDSGHHLLATLHNLRTKSHNNLILELEKLKIASESSKRSLKKTFPAIEEESSNHENSLLPPEPLDILHLHYPLSEDVKVWTVETTTNQKDKEIPSGSKGPSEPETTTIYRNASSNSHKIQAKATGEVPTDIAQVLSQADEVSLIPERGSSEPVFLNYLVPPPKGKKHRRLKKRRWCRCCRCCRKCKKKAKTVKMENAANAEQGLNSYEPDSDSDSSSDSSTGDQSKSTSKRMTQSIGRSTVRLRLPNNPRRTRIPDRPNISLNLWGLLKNSLGKELSKIPMPVNFSEPLSMLQRLTEDYEYSDILDKASKCSDSSEQMCYVAAFTISSYASTSVRTAKPFNPLLGETYEWDRTDDLGWRSISEQTSHHPPTAALYCESLTNGWKCWQEFTMTSKFKGNSLEIVPLGVAHLTFEASGNHYTWRKVTTVVRNIILGKLWVEQTGDMVITNHTTGDKCFLTYVPSSFFSKKDKEVTGKVKNKSGNVKWVLNGSWDSKVEAAQIKVVSTSTSSKNPKRKPSENSFITTAPTVLWVRRPAPPEAEKYYNFTEFAVHMNELEPDVAPTDSRLRPDQRLMENGKWDEANAEKLRLEDKQRNAKKLTSQSKQTIGTSNHQPAAAWFQKEKDPVEGSAIYTYKGEYWKCKREKDWSRCPDIF